MASDTKKQLRSQVMYSVFVRQYSREGTLRRVEEDLDRIRSIGTDIIWLMPIHPIGEKNRKGTLGSPYAVRDYRAVNPELGTMDDLRSLAAAAHRRGMKCIIDVVYNHTSPDSVLAHTHPEWFFHRADGSFGNRIGDWTDVVDLDYSASGLWDYQIDTLKMWAETVDGFRCDVAPLVPLDFWLRARREVAAVRPDCLWLAESVEPPFILENRARGIPCLSDSELYQAFDVCYDYDAYWDFRGCVYGAAGLDVYAASLARQEYVYPDNYVKLRFLENHDRERAAGLIPDARSLRNWTAFLYFQKGMTLIYNGQERACTACPGLFDRDTIDFRAGEDMSPLMLMLYRIKKDPIFSDGAYRVSDGGSGVLTAEYRAGDRIMQGVFSTGGLAAEVRVPLRDGNYVNLIDGTEVRVSGGRLRTAGEPAIIDARLP
jgi:glycosidase